jgi:hypothetical protein
MPQHLYLKVPPLRFSFFMKTASGTGTRSVSRSCDHSHLAENCGLVFYDALKFWEAPFTRLLVHIAIPDVS